MGAIISASRRTDIPAFYLDWFLNRCRAGFCHVPNPFNLRQVRRVLLRRQDVAAVVLWTKDPAPLLSRLSEMDGLGLPYVILHTLNSYPRDLEPGLARVEKRLARFRALAEHVGPGRTAWRYDPIILSNRTPHDWHAERFADMARALRGATRRVIVSFLDLYRKTERGLKPLEAAGWRFLRGAEDAPETHALLRRMAAAARANGMQLQACAEALDYTADGVPPGACIDGAWLHRAVGAAGHGQEDPNQRQTCRCVASRDIGVPDTCLHGCVYCYATRSPEAAAARHACHDPQAPMLWRPE